ncbi:MAG TPA: hypothetical protein VKN18_25145 [Blastocatellia bacterium]|nr:hypothetical protein [Blastocatellia bacterium]
MDDALRVLVEMHKSEFNYYFQPPPYNLKEPIRRIEFWSDIVEGVD